MLRSLRRLAFVALCLAPASPVCADATQDKLRDLIRLPGMTATFQFGYQIRDGYELTTEADTPKQTPVSLRATLRGDAADAPIYFTMGNLYAESGKPIDALAAYTQCAALYREQVKTAPDDGVKWARLAFALHQAQRKAERDTALSDALMRAPKEAQVWDARAELALADANAALSGQSENLNDADAPFRMATLLKQSRPKEKLRAALSLVEQARSDYDRAIQVAPDDWHGYANRFYLSLDYQMETTLLKEALADKPTTDDRITALATEYPQAMLSADTLRDLTTAARVSHDEPYALGMAAYFLILQEGARHPDIFDVKRGGGLKRLSEADQKIELDLMAHMEALTHSPDPTLAGRSAVALGIVQLLLLSPEQSRVTLLHAQTLLPDDPIVVESLLFTYGSADKWADAQSVLTAALAHRESARWRMMRAKAEEHQKHWEEAERDVNTLLRYEPNNLNANLAHLALTLRRAQGDDAMRAYGVESQHTRELIGTNFTAEQKFSFNYLGGIYYALNGGADEARKYLKDAQGTDEQNADVKAVLALLPQ